MLCSSAWSSFDSDYKLGTCSSCQCEEVDARHGVLDDAHDHDGGTNAYKRTKLPALTHNFKYKLSMYQVKTKTSLYASTKSPSLTSLYGNENNHQYWIKHNAIFILANRISHFHILSKQVQSASTHVLKKMFIPPRSTFDGLLWDRGSMYQVTTKTS